MSDGPDPESFVEVMLPAVKQAAAIARALEGQVANEGKAAESAVKAALTIADSAAQEAILVPLLERFPEVTLAAEEDTPTAELFPTAGPARVVVDPIDGTLRSYLEGGGPYATIVGLEVAGRYEAGLVALPREGLLFDGIRGGGARRTRPRGQPRTWRAMADTRRVLAHYAVPEAACETLRAAGYEIVRGCGGAVSVAPLIPGCCAGLRLADDISIRGRAGLTIAEAGGALHANERGEPFPPETEAPARVLAVAADQADLEALLDAIAPCL